MTPESQAEEAREWLRVAASDLRLAERALSVEPPIIGLALYHAQQAAEKALKGFLVLHGARYRLTHNLAELLRLCIPFDATLEQEVLPALDLTDFATRIRYPGETEEPELEAAKRWVRVSETACESVRRRIPAQPSNSAG